jgi:integrase/recombinase XerD
MAQRNVSQSHLSNTSVAIEHYMRFIGTPIRLGRQTKPNKTIRGVLSEEEIGRLIGAAKSLRDRTILVLLAYSGIRNNELCTLQVGDVDLSNGHINVRGTKIARDRVIMMPDPCVHVLAKYMEEQDGNQSDPLFVTKRNGNVFEQQDLRKLVRVCAERAGIKKRVYPHLIRHSLATNLMHSGTGLLAIKQQMGHVHLGTTMRYLHADPERMRREYLLHAPNYLPSDD